MMQRLDMNITMDDLRRGIFMWCFFSLWQIMFVDGVSVGFVGAVIIPSLLVHCRGKVHSRSHHYMFRMVYRNHSHVLRMVYRSHCYVLRMVNMMMIEIQDVSDWVVGGVLCGMLKHASIPVELFMLNNGGRC